MDEPSSNLDPKNRRSFIKLIKGLKKTIILATHNLDPAYEVSDRAIILNNGKIAFGGCAIEILKHKDFLETNGLDCPLYLVMNSNNFQRKPKSCFEI